jgi:hypothetical protein
MRPRVPERPLPVQVTGITKKLVEQIRMVSAEEGTQLRHRRNVCAGMLHRKARKDASRRGSGHFGCNMHICHVHPNVAQRTGSTRHSLSVDLAVM